jgi:hypothetical protein
MEIFKAAVHAPLVLSISGKTWWHRCPHLCILTVSEEGIDGGQTLINFSK